MASQRSAESEMSRQIGYDDMRIEGNGSYMEDHSKMDVENIPSLKDYDD